MNSQLLALIIILVVLNLFAPSNCYIHRISSSTSTLLQRSRILEPSSSFLVFSSKTPPAVKEEEKGIEEKGERVQVGSEAYYKGFFSSDLKDPSINTNQRGDGLDQAFKLGSYTAVFLSVLLLAFLASNGLI